MEEIKQYIKNALDQIKQDFFITQDCDYENILISTPHPKFQAHYSCNALFALLSNLKPGFENPLKKSLLQNPMVDDVQFVQGYINLKMNSKFFENLVQKMNNESILPNVGNHEKVNVEYCSINPTGYLHIGHARNAIIGDAVARLLQKLQYDVTKEYYINDAGNQINLLAQSIQKAANGLPMEENDYKGPEIKEIAQKIPKDGSLEEIGQIAMQYFLGEIKKDLEALRVHHDVWVSEKQIIKDGYIEKAVEILKKKDLLYYGLREDKKNEKGAISKKDLLLFKTTDFGDTEDRPITKEDGQWTYFAPDIGYHLNKIERGFNNLICVLGADHDSYALRLKIAVQALKENIEHNIIICQMVSFEHNGNLVKFSKRAGTAIRTKEFIAEIDAQILRFMILSKNAGTPFVFDYENAVNISFKNPVFYIQYAYARAASILRKKKGEMKADNIAFAIPEFQELIVNLSNFDNILKEAGLKLQPHIIATYAHKLAENFHKLWQIGKMDVGKKFIIEESNLERTSIVTAFMKTMKELLDILGLDAPEEMQ
jgi:arginyl-tRNA synthetase